MAAQIGDEMANRSPEGGAFLLRELRMIPLEGGKLGVRWHGALGAGFLVAELRITLVECGQEFLITVI